jgi:cephalosporin hydroxylase
MNARLVTHTLAMPLLSRTGRLRWYFDHNDGRLIHKWLHYFPIYEQVLAPYRGRACTLLEIGVSHGGSLQMWRSYLGRRSRIVGIDIEPRVADLAEDGIDVRVGDQSDPEFLDRLVAIYGSFDVVIDDGSHVPAHQIASIERLWPHVADGGQYVVEDLHSNYWPEFGAGRGQSHTFMAWLGERIDDMHAFHTHEPGFEPNTWTRTLGAVHVYDSLAVLGKATLSPPEHRKTGRPAFDDVYGIEFEDQIDELHRAQLEALSSPMARLRRARRDPMGTAQRTWNRVRVRPPR